MEAGRDVEILPSLEKLLSNAEELTASVGAMHLLGRGFIVPTAKDAH